MGWKERREMRIENPARRQELGNHEKHQCQDISDEICNEVSEQRRETRYNDETRVRQYTSIQDMSNERKES